MPRNYSTTTVKRLFALSGYFCAFPGCRTAIYERVGGQDVLVGEIAHIEGSSDEGPRANSTLTGAERDHFNNLILLCPTHHLIVDKIDGQYPAELLRQWKKEAAKATRDRLSAGMSDVTFAELEMICDAFAQSGGNVPSTPMSAPEIQAKMTANGLTDAVGYMMTVGLAQAGMVADFISRIAQINRLYPGQLRAGFIERYDKAVMEGVTGDDLFVSLVDDATNAVVTPQSDHHRLWTVRSAALAVVCHLFELCELFEAPR